MADTLLSRLMQRAEVVPETAELALIEHFRPKHVNLSASRIAAAAQLPEHAALVDHALGWAQKKCRKGANRRMVAIEAVEHLAIEFARAILDRIPGHVSVEVDGRLAYQRRQMIDRARALMDQLEEAGVERSRVLLKIPATWEGIQAAEKLATKSGIGCHLTLVFGMHQVAAAADAGAAVIAPAVGRISDFCKKRDGVDDYAPADDPGVAATQAMRDYLERHGYASRLMPGTFRGLSQALALADCGLLTLPPKLLSLLEQEPSAELSPPPASCSGEPPAKLAMDATLFQAMHSADPIAQSKLASGVKNLSWAVVSQEKQLADWITARQDEAAHGSTLALFRIWDYDGDGFIDREEWSGTEEVFNALDRDNNGRISLEEMAIGLGAPYKPQEPD